MAAFSPRTIYPFDPRKSKLNKLFIFIIPGIESYNPTEWPLVDTLTGDCTGYNSEITVLDHGLRRGSLRSAEDLLTSGTKLLSCYHDFKSRRQASECSVGFVCHSLGGLMLKKALVDANHEDRTKNGRYDILDALRWIVFIGTPHLTQENKIYWDNLAKIIGATPETGELLQVTESQVAIQSIITVCHKFEEIDATLPFLTFHETRETKFQNPGGPRASSSSSCVLVPKDFASLQVASEVVLSVEANHSEICKLRATRYNEERFSSFISAAMKVKDDGGSPRPPSLSYDDRSPFYDPAKHTTLDEPLNDDDFPPQRRRSRKNSRRSNPLPVAGLADTDEPKSSRNSIPLSFRHRLNSGESFANSSISSSFPTISSPTTLSPSLTNISLAQRRVQLPCVVKELGCIVDDFSGRRDLLAQMREMLLPSAVGKPFQRQGLSSFVLCACGGMGKTSVAAKFFSDCERENAFDAMFWARADKREYLATQFMEFAFQLGIYPHRGIQHRATSRHTLLQWLARPHSSFETLALQKTPISWLLVLDNIEDLALLRDYWPIAGTGSIIITTRNPEIRDFESRYCAIQEPSIKDENFITLPGFTEFESTEFLQKLVQMTFGTTHDQESFHSTVAALEGIPLALRQVATFVKRRNMRLKEFLKIYKDEDQLRTVFEEKAYTPTMNYDDSLATVWTSDGLSPMSLRLIQVLALLDSKEIAETILEQAKRAQVKDFPVNTSAYSDARAELWRKSLVEMNHAAESIRMHRLVQAEVRIKMSAIERQQAFDTAARLLWAAWPREKKVWNYTTGETWERCRVIVPHVQSLVNHFFKASEAGKNALKSPEPFVKLLIYSGWYHHDTGSSEDAEPKFALAEKLCDQEKGDDKETLIEIYSSRGAVASETNDVERCLQHYRRMLDLTREHFKDALKEQSEVKLAIAFNELGVGLMMKNDIRSAREHFERAKIITASHMYNGNEIASRFFSLSSANLGLAYWIEDRFYDADDVLKTALRKFGNRDGSIGDDSFILGRFYHALGNVYESMNKLAEAQEWHTKAFTHYQDHIGLDHHRTADVAVRMSDHFVRLGDYASGRVYINRATSVFGKKTCYKPELIRATHRLSLLAFKEGYPEEAKRHCEVALRILHELKMERAEQWSRIELTAKYCNTLVTFWSR